MERKRQEFERKSSKKQEQIESSLSLLETEKQKALQQRKWQDEQHQHTLKKQLSDLAHTKELAMHESKLEGLRHEEQQKEIRNELRELAAQRDAARRQCDGAKAEGEEALCRLREEEQGLLRGRADAESSHKNALHLVEVALQSRREDLARVEGDTAQQQREATLMQEQVMRHVQVVKQREEEWERKEAVRRKLESQVKAREEELQEAERRVERASDQVKAQEHSSAETSHRLKEGAQRVAMETAKLHDARARLEQQQQVLTRKVEEVSRRHRGNEASTLELEESKRLMVRQGADLHAKETALQNRLHAITSQSGEVDKARAVLAQQRQRLDEACRNRASEASRAEKEMLSRVQSLQQQQSALNDQLRVVEEKEVDVLQQKEDLREREQQLQDHHKQLQEKHRTMQLFEQSLHKRELAAGGRDRDAQEYESRLGTREEELRKEGTALLQERHEVELSRQRLEVDTRNARSAQDAELRLMEANLDKSKADTMLLVKQEGAKLKVEAEAIGQQELDRLQRLIHSMEQDAASSQAVYTEQLHHQEMALKQLQNQLEQTAVREKQVRYRHRYK